MPKVFRARAYSIASSRHSLANLQVCPNTPQSYAEIPDYLITESLLILIVVVVVIIVVVSLWNNNIIIIVIIIVDH